MKTSDLKELEALLQQVHDEQMYLIGKYPDEDYTNMSQDDYDKILENKEQIKKLALEIKQLKEGNPV